MEVLGALLGMLRRIIENEPYYYRRRFLDWYALGCVLLPSVQWPRDGTLTALFT